MLMWLQRTASGDDVQVDQPLPTKQPFQRLGSGLPASKDNNASAPIYAARENYPNIPNVPTHAIHRNESGRYGMPVYH